MELSSPPAPPVLSDPPPTTTHRRTPSRTERFESALQAARDLYQQGGPGAVDGPAAKEITNAEWRECVGRLLTVVDSMTMQLATHDELAANLKIARSNLALAENHSVMLEDSFTRRPSVTVLGPGSIPMQSRHSTGGQDPVEERRKSLIGLGLDERVASTLQVHDTLGATLSSKSFFSRIPNPLKSSPTIPSSPSLLDLSTNPREWTIPSPRIGHLGTTSPASSIPSIKTKSPSQKAVSTLLFEVSNLKSSLTLVSTECVTLHNTNDLLRSEVSTLQATIEQLERTKGQLLEELEKVSVELFSEANEMVAGERKSRASAEGQAEHAKAEVANLEVQVEGLKAQLSALTPSGNDGDPSGEEDVETSGQSSAKKDSLSIAIPAAKALPPSPSTLSPSSEDGDSTPPTSSNHSSPAKENDDYLFPKSENGRSAGGDDEDTQLEQLGLHAEQGVDVEKSSPPLMPGALHLDPYKSAAESECEGSMKGSDVSGATAASPNLVNLMPGFLAFPGPPLRMKRPAPPKEELPLPEIDSPLIPGRPETIFLDSEDSLAYFDSPVDIPPLPAFSPVLRAASTHRSSSPGPHPSSPAILASPLPDLPASPRTAPRSLPAPIMIAPTKPNGRVPSPVAGRVGAGRERKERAMSMPASPTISITSIFSPQVAHPSSPNQDSHTSPRQRPRLASLVAKDAHDPLPSIPVVRSAVPLIPRAKQRKPGKIDLSFSSLNGPQQSVPSPLFSPTRKSPLDPWQLTKPAYPSPLSESSSFSISAAFAGAEPELEVVNRPGMGRRRTSAREEQERSLAEEATLARANGPNGLRWKEKANTVPLGGMHFLSPTRDPRRASEASYFSIPLSPSLSILSTENVDMLHALQTVTEKPVFSSPFADAFAFPTPASPKRPSSPGPAFVNGPIIGEGPAPKAAPLGAQGRKTRSSPPVASQPRLLNNLFAKAPGSPRGASRPSPSSLSASPPKTPTPSPPSAHVVVLPSPTLSDASSIDSTWSDSRSAGLGVYPKTRGRNGSASSSVDSLNDLMNILSSGDLFGDESALDITDCDDEKEEVLQELPKSRAAVDTSKIGWI